MLDLKREHRLVYDRLQDEESWLLFKCRYKYWLSGDREYLRELQKIYYEFCGNTESAKWLELINDGELTKNGVIVYGAGIALAFLISDMNYRKIKIAAVCDSDAEKHGKTLRGYVVEPPDDVFNGYEGEPVIISTLHKEYKREIHAYLLTKGVPGDSIYYYCSDEAKQYFGCDFMRPVENEFYIDAGSYDGKTILDFYEFSESGKVYAFEPDKVCYKLTYEIIKKNKLDNVELFPYGLWHKKEVLNFLCQVNTAGSRIDDNGTVQIKTAALDDMVAPSERVTLIKMDIEGAELNALKGCKGIIQKDLPRLAVCVYHKPEDIVEIPQYILSLNSGYRFYLRHHVPWFDCETVLYAIP